MSERAIIAEQIKRKHAEIQVLEEKIKVARIYVRALEDVMRAVDRGEPDAAQSGGEATLRRGSLVAQAREVMLARNEPIHIDDLLAALGKDVNRESKASLAGSLAAYVRKGEVFSRPAPSTFGLVELGHKDSDAIPINDPPPGFGQASSIDMDDEIPF